MGQTRAMRIAPAALALVTVAVLAGCGDDAGTDATSSSPTTTPTTTPTATTATASAVLQGATQACSGPISRANHQANAAGHPPAVDVAQDGHSVAIVTGDGSADGSSAGSRAASCLLRELGASSSLRGDVEASYGSADVRTVAESGLSYRWHYESDSGLNMTVRATA